MHGGKSTFLMLTIQLVLKLILQIQVMRANQRRVAQSLGGAPRTDTRDVKRGLAVVPFRHSKLTEVLMDYFVGDGKAVGFFPN